MANSEHDRRQEKNWPLTDLINMGITFKRVGSDGTALTFLASSLIPEALAARVLAEPTRRRMTDWERVR